MPKMHPEWVAQFSELVRLTRTRMILEEMQEYFVSESVAYGSMLWDTWELLTAQTDQQMEDHFRLMRNSGALWRPEKNESDNLPPKDDRSSQI